MESDDTNNADDAIEAFAAGDGSASIVVDDVTTTALELAERLSAVIVEGADEFESAIVDLEHRLAERVAAHAAVELLARAGAPPAPHEVTDVVTMRRLVERVAAADSLVEASREAAQSRAMAASEITVHPTSIRAAADDVVDARAALDARRVEADDARRRETEPEPDRELTPLPGDTGSPAHPPTPRRFTGWRLTDTQALGKPVLVAVVALVIGVLTLVLTRSPLALAIPGVAVCWVVVLIVRQRDDAYDEEIASRNLANVTRLTDRAYGGAEAIAEAAADAEDPVVQQANQAVREAENRLAFAEASWRSLVGPDADADDIDSVLAKHDAQYRLGDHAIDELPAVRTAAAHRRRLVAQWKLAWWALDRPVPAMSAAADAVAALEAEGLTTVTIPGRSADGLSQDERRRLDELAGGRGEDELRAAAEVAIRPVVVADEDGEISADRFREATAHLPGDVRVVVVAPTG